VDGSGALNDCTVTLVLVGNEVLVLSNNGRVVASACVIVVNGIALMLTRDMVVEDTETVTTI